MYILSVDPPVASYFSQDSAPVDTPSLSSPSSIAITASLFIDVSHLSSSPDCWMFDCPLNMDHSSNPLLGVGDLIDV